MRYNRKSAYVTASADSPAISTALMKSFLKVDGDGDNDIIAAYVIVAVAVHFEKRLQDRKRHV